MPPPVDLAPEPVQRGKLFWTWDGFIITPFPVIGSALGRFPVRMCIAGYPIGDDRTGLVVISPLEPTDKVVEWLNKTGDVCFVVAPNKHHSWWAAAMKAAFPAALLVAPLGLALKRPSLPVDIRITPLAGAQDMPGSWPAAVMDVIHLQGLSFLDELVFLHKPSSTLLLTDTAFNFDAECMAAAQPGLPLRLYLSWAGGRCCCMTKPFRWLISDAVALKASFDQLLATWEFEQVSMAHGSFISKGGKQAFLEGSCAFVDELLNKRQAPRGEGLAGTGAAMFTAAAVISTAVGIGLAGIMQARQQ